MSLVFLFLAGCGAPAQVAGDPKEALPVAASASAKEKPRAEPPVQETKAEGEEEETRPAPTVALEREELTVSLDDEGRASRTYRVRFRILDKRAIEPWSTISESWSPWHQERAQIQAKVTSPDGRVDTLDQKTISESPERELGPNMFSDRRVVTAPLPQLMVGSVVEYETSIKDTQPFFLPGTMGRYRVGGEMAISGGSSLRLEFPEKFPFHYRVYAFELKPKIEVKNGRKLVVFESGPLDRLEPPEPYSAPDSINFPHIRYSMHRSWAELAAQYGTVVEKQLARADVTALIASAKKEPTREKKISALMKILHKKVRYTGLELGEAAVVPRMPEETLARGYGDCKDKATLLVAMLRGVGIDAQVALLSTGFGIDAEPELPGLQSFDHAIVYVPGAQPIWIDATLDLGGLGTVPAGVRGRMALVAGPKTKGLQQITPDRPDLNRYFELREFYLSDFGPARVVETSHGEGSIETSLRHRFAAQPVEDLTKQLAQYAKDAYNAEKIDKIDRFNQDDVDDRFRLRLELLKARNGYTSDYQANVVFDGTTALFQWLPGYITDVKTEKKRKADFIWTNPQVAEIRYRIVPASGFELRAVPEPINYSFGPAQLTGTFENGKDGVLTAVFRFDSKKTRYTADEVNAFRAGLKEYQQTKQIIAVFDHAASRLIKAGDLVQGLAKSRDWVKKEPKNAFHHIHMAEALLAAGFGEESKKEAREGVALAPNQMIAHFKLGWTLMSDFLGRELARGADLQGALASFRKAKELDPKNRAARQNIAYILEHNDDVVRYGKGAKLDEAIAEYRALRKDLDDKDLDLNLLAVLFHAKKYQEAKTFAKEVSSSLNRHALEAASVAIVDGKAPAMNAVNDLGLSAADRFTVLQGTTEWLLRARKYALAAEILSAAAAGTEQAIALQTRASVLAKVKPIEELANSPTGLRAVFFQVMRASLAEDAAALKSLMSAGALQEQNAREKVSTDPAPWASALAGMKRALSRAQMSDEMLMDFAASVLELQIEGDDPGGYRVSARASMVPGRPSSDWFFVFENGKHKLRALDTEPVSIAAEALSRAQKGDLDGASRWLSWRRKNSGDSVSAATLETDPTKRAALLKSETALSALGVQGPSAELVLSIVQKNAAAEPEKDALVAAAIDALRLAGKKEDAYKAAVKALEAHPKSTYVLWASARAFVATKRYEQSAVMAEKWLNANTGDQEVRQNLAYTFMHLGQFKKADELYSASMQAEPMGPGGLNNYAWNSFLLGEYEKGVNAALQAVSQSQQEASPSLLHTLATLYAETGKVAEAMQALRTSLDLRAAEAEKHDWYVIGRIAEHYALYDAAKAAYAKASDAGADPGKDDISHVAKKRLALLPR